MMSNEISDRVRQCRVGWKRRKRTGGRKSRERGSYVIEYSGAEMGS